MEAPMNRALLLLLTALLAGPAQAYVILESKYHVEVEPGKFEDQLVLKCDNGRKISVGWDARLSEVCGEVVIPKGAVATPSVNTAQQREKDFILSNVREQYGNVDERHIEDERASGETQPHFSPQMRAVLKKYEVCRKQSKNSQACAAARDRALAALQQPAAESNAEAAPASKPKAAAKDKAAPAQPDDTERAAAVEAIDAPTGAEPEAAPASADAAPASDRSTLEQKIAEDYTRCMRAKPKFECETDRAAALKALGLPTKTKAKRKPHVAATN